MILSTLYSTRTGEPTEIRYKLQGFGFPSEKIPITHTGTIKTTTLKKWMAFRHFQENQFCHDTTATECPYLTDVLFRKGINMNSNPGNANLRRIMHSKIENGALDKNENYKTRQFISDIVQELKIPEINSETMQQSPPIRLLEWDDTSGGYWKEITDEDSIYHKIRHLVREFQGIAKGEATAKRKTQAIINQGGGTSIFQFSDRRESSSIGACLSYCEHDNNKKQKMNGDI